MKRITAIALLAIANFAMAGTSFAQSETVQVRVPFDFTVSDQLLPSGTYSIKTVSPAILDIKNRDNSVAVLVVVNQAGTTSPHGGKLRFHKYGDQYFLSEISIAGKSRHLYFWPSRAEQELQVAGNKTTPTGVEVALMDGSR